MAFALLTEYWPFKDLPDEDRSRVAKAIVLKEMGARQEVVRQGDRSQSVHFVLSGQTCRSKMLPGGDRQILAFMIPGDTCDLHGCFMRALDHGVTTLAPSLLAEIPTDTVLRWVSECPNIALALLAIKVADEAILREWLTNASKRPATQRIAHLLCEMFTRFRSVGLCDSQGFEFHITQEELAQSIGLSVVHVNRSLQTLKADDLVTWQRHHVKIHDFARLCNVAGFDHGYLQSPR